MPEVMVPGERALLSLLRISIPRWRNELSWNPDRMAENKKKLLDAYVVMARILGVKQASEELGINRLVIDGALGRRKL